MPEIAAAQTAADMTYAKPHEFMPTGGSNRRAARMQAAALRWLVRMAALLTAAVLVFLIGYILVMGIPNLKPELFAWEYNSENVSLTPALINTVLMTAFSLAISTPLGIFAAIWLVEYAHRGSFVQLTGTQDTAAHRRFSLEDKVSPTTPPVFVWHTMEDETVPVENTLLLVSALHRAGVPCEAHLFEKGCHGTSLSTAEVNHPSAHRSRWLTLAREWLDDTFDFHLGTGETGG
mgnify:CR=1 FL=1